MRVLLRHAEHSRRGFDDAFIYREMALPPVQRGIPIVHAAGESAARPFQNWADKIDRTKY